MTPDTLFYQEPARQIPVVRNVDVLVVGGGPAGLAAAICAAREGARTLLVEQFACLGGTATASLMACINAFRNQVEPDGLQAVRGIAEEIVLRLKEINGLGKSPYQQKAYPTEPGQMEYSYAIDTEKFKYLTLKMAIDAGVEVMFHTWFAAPILEGDSLRGVLVENKSGRQAYLAKVIVDASGDGDVAARAGAPYWQTYTNEAPRLIDSLMYRIAFGAARPAGTFGCDLGNTAVVWGPGNEPMDCSNADNLSRSEISTRLRVYEDLAEKVKHHPELADARVIETPALLGVRQTRFIEGEYKLTAEDAITGRRFEDVVAISPAPIIHFYGYRRYLEHEGFDIPYRCLVPQKVENLLVAGRCISGEQQPYESFRSMIPIMAIGQAAGVAAAQCCKTNATPRAVDVKAVQEALLKQNAELRMVK